MGWTYHICGLVCTTHLNLAHYGKLTYLGTPKRKKRTPKGCFGFFLVLYSIVPSFFYPQEFSSSSSFYMNIFARYLP